MADIRLRFIADGQGEAVASLSAIFGGITGSASEAGAKISAEFDAAARSIRASLEGLSRSGLLDGIAANARAATGQFAELAETISKSVSMAERLATASRALREASGAVAREEHAVSTGGRSIPLSGEQAVAAGLRSLIPEGAIGKIEEAASAILRELREARGHAGSSSSTPATPTHAGAGFAAHGGGPGAGGGGGAAGAGGGGGAGGGPLGWLPSALAFLTSPQLASTIYTLRNIASWADSLAVSPAMGGLGNVIHGTEAGRRFQYAVAGQTGSDGRAAAIDRALIVADQGQDIDLQTLRNSTQQAAFLSPLADQFTNGTPATAAASGLDYAKLIQRLSLVDPERDANAIANAVREALGGDLRGLTTRIGLDPAAIAAMNGRRSTDLQNDPAALLNALEKYAATLVPGSALRREGSLVSVTAQRFAELPGLAGQRIGEDGAYDAIAGQFSGIESGPFRKIAGGAWDADFQRISDAIVTGLDHTEAALSKFAQAVTGTTDNSAAVDALADGFANLTTWMGNLTKALPPLAEGLGSITHAVIAAAQSASSAVSGNSATATATRSIVSSFFVPALSMFSGSPSAPTPAPNPLAAADAAVGLSGQRDASLLGVGSAAANILAKATPAPGRGDALGELLENTQRAIAEADRANPFGQLKSRLNDLLAKLSDSDALAPTLSPSDAAALMAQNAAQRAGLDQQFPIAGQAMRSRFLHAATGANVAALSSVGNLPPDVGAQLATDAVYGTGSIADAAAAAVQRGGLSVDRQRDLGLGSLPLAEQGRVLDLYAQLREKAVTADAQYGGPLPLRSTDDQLMALASRLPQTTLEQQPELAGVNADALRLATGERDQAAAALAQPGGRTAANELAYDTATAQVEKFAAALRDITERVPSLLDQLAKVKPGLDALTTLDDYSAAVGRFRDAGGTFDTAGTIADAGNRQQLGYQADLERIRGLSPNPNLSPAEVQASAAAGSNVIGFDTLARQAQLASLTGEQPALTKAYTAAQQSLQATSASDPNYQQRQDDFGRAATALGDNASKVEELKRSLDPAYQTLQQFGSSVRQSIESSAGTALDSLITHTGRVSDAFRQMGLSILSSFSNLAADAAFQQVARLFAGAAAGGGGFGGLMMGLSGGVNGKADGGVFSGGITPFADGGVVSHTRPMLGLVGEAGRDEAVVPMSGGSIPLGIRNGGLAALLPKGRHVPASMVGYADGGIAPGGFGPIDSGFSAGSAISAMAGPGPSSRAAFHRTIGPGENGQGPNVYVVHDVDEATRLGMRRNTDLLVDLVAQNVQKGGKIAKTLRGQTATTGTR